MKTTEILEIENNNSNNIFLFKEGIFWRCYELSVLHFIRNIREYRIFKKFIKTVNQDIIYLGFPDTIIDEILKSAKNKGFTIDRNETKINIYGIEKENGFIKWKKNIKTAEKENKDNNNQIIRKIIEFPIINKTPVEAFNFLVEIQNEVKISVANINNQ